jgi:lipopolysaccharide transport system permease protein
MSSPMTDAERAEAAVPESGGGPKQPPWLVILPGSTPLRQYIRDVAHHRDLIRVLAGREIKLRYRQTALGVTWVLLGPLLSAGILGFVFGKVAKLPTDTIPFFIFSYAGLAVWGLFSTSTTRGTSAYVSNAALVSRIYFPRVILPMSNVMSVLLDFGVSLVVLLILLFTNDLLPTWTFLVLPVWLFLFLALAQGIGGLLGSMAVRYRDIPQVTPVVLQLMLYASPIAYAASAVPEEYQNWYYLNPLASLFDAARWSFFGGASSPPDLPATGWLVYSVAFCLITFAVGIITLERMEGRFADVI